MNISDKAYDVLKWIAQILLPALATLYFGLSQVWNTLPYVEQITGSIMAVDAFLGLLLGLTAKTYNDNLKINPEYQQKTLPNPQTKFEIGANGLVIQLSTDIYDALVWVAQYFLPAAGTLVFALSGIWEFEVGQQIVGVIAVFDTFLGTLLGISTAQYNRLTKLRSG